MPTAVVTVQYADPQKPGKKNATIKGMDGSLYFVPPEMFPHFTVGNSYNLTYKDSSFTSKTDGKRVQFFVVEKAEPTAAGPAPSSNRNQPAARYQDDMAVAERIFVCGAFNNMMANVNVLPLGLDERDLTMRVNIFREVWRKTFGNPQQSRELDDEIPH